MKQDKAAKKTMFVDSYPAAAEKTRQWLLAQLNQFEFGDDDVFAVQLAFQEAFFNAIKHGNKMDVEKKVKIDLLIDNDRIEISMTDTGSGFDPDAVPDCRVGENLYKPEGRGLLLMRSYMDIVEFNDVGNSVHMVRFPRGVKSPAPTARR
jgi:serine/threonine-protein kinase RsbW